MLQKTMTLLLQIIQEFNQLKKINKKYIIIFFNLRERRRGGGQGGVLIIIWGLLALLRDLKLKLVRSSLFLGQYFLYLFYNCLFHTFLYSHFICMDWVG